MLVPVSVLAQASSKIRAGDLEVTFERSGAYSVANRQMGITLTGKLPGAAESIRSSAGADALGEFHQLDALYDKGERRAEVRVYRGRGTVLFSDIHKTGGANEDPFPALSQPPQSMMRFSYRVKNFSPIDFGKLDSQGPWVFFDRERRTMVFSPADNFLVSEMDTSANGEMRSGISPKIASLPSDFAHRTLLVFGDGVTSTLDTWGGVLQRMNHKQPIANDADVVLDRFGYWTDNGAKYYYKFDPALGYEGTLLAIRDEFNRLGVPLGYLQLDSWWYPKQKGNNAGSDNGALEYRADPTIFPDGLDGFEQRLKLPLVTHARWIGSASPYRSEYKMSDNVIIDPRYWNATAKYLHDGGVVVYEQDWLDKNARPAIDIDQAHAYLADMADSMAAEGIGIQYCMPLPDYFMASTQFANLRTIRTSDDRFLPARYDTFLYTSELAHAVGLWPWADVFMSSELSNLVVATLSAGSVGTGDSLGAIDADHLRRAVRADSVILKPDTPLIPLDAMYLDDASEGQSAQSPMVASTKSNFGNVAETYVFSYPRAADQTTAQVQLSELGISKPVYAWNWRTQTGALIPADGSLTLHDTDGWDYEVLARVSREGIALLGDVSKIVPLARKRFSSVTSSGTLEAVLAFADNESAITLTGYADHRPSVSASTGHADHLQYNEATHLFSVEVSPGREHTAKVRIR